MSLPLALFIALACLGTLHAYDYCDNGLGKRLCRRKEHFICDPTQAKQGETFKYTYPNIRDWIERMLDWHNDMRNTLAGGEEKNSKGEFMPTASRMRVLQWDPELAYLSYMHVLRCNATKTSCFRSKTFYNAGQTVSRVKLAMNETALGVLKKHMDAWYKERRELTTEDFKKISIVRIQLWQRYMQVINDEVSKVGCAMSFCSECIANAYHAKYCYFMTCHYSFGITMNYRPYKSGPPASNCDYWATKPSKKYSNLCDNNGVDYPDIVCLGTEILECKRQGEDVDKWSALAHKPQPITYNYCHPPEFEAELCRRYGGKHFICHPDEVPQKGILKELYPIDTKFINFVLDQHNKYRNILASGKDTNEQGDTYPAAGRMRVLVWNDELAYVSKMHVQKCNFMHSHCNVIPRFLLVGQNLGITNAAKPAEEYETIALLIKMFFLEKNIPKGDQLNVVVESIYKQIGHFVVAAADEVARVGCAYAYCNHCKDDKLRPLCYMITCHYDYIPGFGQRIYFPAAKPTSDCDYWNSKPDTRYPNLCANDDSEQFVEPYCDEKNVCSRDGVPVDEWKAP